MRSDDQLKPSPCQVDGCENETYNIYWVPVSVGPLRLTTGPGVRVCDTHYEELPDRVYWEADLIEEEP